MNLKRVIALLLTIMLIMVSLFFSRFSNEVKRNNIKNLISNQNKNIENIVSKGSTDDTVAVLSIDYVITNDEYYNQLMDNLESIKNNDDIKAVIIKMNTPGGSTYEATRIVDKIQEIKQTKKIPFYISMQSMCASAGYYISSICDKIYALPETTTGSIGVKISLMNYSDLLGKVGIKNEDVTSGKFKDLGSSSKPMTPEERQIFQTLVDRSYQRFIDTVSKGRKMEIEKVKKIADGRIYDGGQALDLHLIDKIGDYNTVLNDLKKDFNLSDPKIVEYNYNDRFNDIFSFLGSIEDLKKSDAQKTIEYISNYEANYSGRLMYLYGGN